MVEATAVVVELSWMWWWGSHCGVEVGGVCGGDVMKMVVEVVVVMELVVVVD